jgi:hypothetical protein
VTADLVACVVFVLSTLAFVLRLGGIAVRAATSLLVDLSDLASAFAHFVQSLRQAHREVRAARQDSDTLARGS